MEIRKTSSNREDVLADIRERIQSTMQQGTGVSAGSPGTDATRLELTELQELSSAVAENIAIGHLPPGPPTLRGRIGRSVIRVIQRMLFWYTSQINSFHGIVARLARAQFAALDALHQRLETYAGVSETVRADVTELRNQLASTGAELRSEVKLCREEWAQSGRETAASYAQLRSELIALHENVEGTLGLNSAAHSKLIERVSELERALANIRSDVAMQSQRIAVLLSQTRQRPPLDASTLESRAAMERHGLDALYVAFEDVFRGTREDIKNRLRVYLPKLEAAGVGGHDMPVLDIGCGRGEWLELLAGAGLEAKGVDINDVMASQCRERGLNLAESTALDYLQCLPEASLGAVTAFHVLEHLPLPELIAVLDETLRVLKPGGMAIFETPNPANLFVGASTFYTDPTHRNPLPAPTLAFLVEARGLCEVEILPLNPPFEGLQLRNDGSEVVTWVNEHFYGPQDYAVIGKKV